MGMPMSEPHENWPPSPLLTVREAAAYFRVSNATVLRWCAAGKLPTCRIGREWRIHWGRLQEMLESSADPPTKDDPLEHPEVVQVE